MVKNIILIAVICGSVGFAGLQLFRSHGANPASIDDPFPLRCAKCGHTFTLTAPEMRKLISAGRVASPEHAARRFPCEKCNEITAVLHQENGNDRPANR